MGAPSQAQGSDRGFFQTKWHLNWVLKKELSLTIQRRGNGLFRQRDQHEQTWCYENCALNHRCFRELHVIRFWQSEVWVSGGDGKEEAVDTSAGWLWKAVNVMLRILHCVLWGSAVQWLRALDLGSLFTGCVSLSELLNLSVHLCLFSRMRMLTVPVLYGDWINTCQALRTLPAT